MSKNVKSDAAPIPTGAPNVEEPVTPPTDRRKSKKEYSSDSSSDSESEFSSGDKYNTYRGKPATNVININKAEDVHIGNRYSYFNSVAASSHHHHHYSETDSVSNDPCKDDKGPRPPEELLNSDRELDADDMYTVAENISRTWKKLARFLPPKMVFTDGQLETFEANNPRDQEEVVYEMLTAWKQKYPKEATVGILALTLWEIGKGAIARKLKP